MTLALVPTSPGAEDISAKETDRKNRVFAWADGVLDDIGLIKRIRLASSLDELRKITFDPTIAEVVLAIREALQPASGVKADHFQGIGKDGLKAILTMRFRDKKKDREKELQRQGGSGSQKSQKSTYDWTNDLKLDKNSAVLGILSNLILFLTHHQAWKGVYAYDAFAARVIIRKRPPWGEETPDIPCTDHHEAKTRVWFQREDIKANGGDVGRAIQGAARDNPYHPVRDYLEARKWDGVPRLDTWLIDHCHAADTVADGTVYVRAVSRRFPISAVARIYQPGCKVDHMPILEGPQGKQKSEALRALAVKDGWFTDRLSHVSSKDAQQEAGGVWLVEIAEMEPLTRASSSSAKQYVTRRVDRYRPPYGKHIGTFPRQCVFAGTVNPPVGGYFTDATGSRRFWPIFCPDMIDLAGIERDRDQLWAEAVHRYKAGEKWWMETPELEALAIAEQDARFKADVWQETVEQWLSKSKDPKDTSVSEVLEGALNINKDAPGLQSAQTRVHKILTHLKFAKHRPRKGDKRQNRYWRP